MIEVGVPIIEMLFRIYKWLEYGEKQPPFKMFISPTDRCNLNCIFCPNSVARKERRFKMEDELEDEEWERVVEDALRLGVKHFVVLGGGEPLLRKSAVLKMFRKVKKFDESIHFEIITNGTLLEKDDLIEFVEKKLNFITISIHGTEDLHSMITGNRSVYQKIVDNLRFLKELKMKCNKKEPVVQINMVLTAYNYKQIEKMMEFFKNYADTLTLHSMRMYEEIENNVKDLRLKEEQKRELKNEINVLRKKEKGIKLRVSTLDDIEGCGEKIFLSNHFKVRCYEPWYSVLVNSDGRVGRCAAFTTRNEPLNIREFTLEEIWYSDFMENVRENVKKNVMMEGCENCGLKDSTRFINRLLPFFMKYVNGEISVEDFVSILRRIEKW